MSDRERHLRIIFPVVVDEQNDRHCSMKCPQLIELNGHAGFECQLRFSDRKLGSNWGKPYRHGRCIELAQVNKGAAE